MAAGNLILNYFIRLAMKLKLEHCFPNICLQHIFCLNSILALLGGIAGCVLYRDDGIHHRAFKTQLEDKHKVHYEGKSPVMDVVPSGICWAGARSCQIALTDVAALCNTLADRREHRQGRPL